MKCCLVLPPNHTPINRPFLFLIQLVTSKSWAFGEWCCLNVPWLFIHYLYLHSSTSPLTGLSTGRCWTLRLLICVFLDTALPVLCKLPLPIAINIYMIFSLFHWSLNLMEPSSFPCLSRLILFLRYTSYNYTLVLACWLSVLRSCLIDYSEIKWCLCKVKLSPVEHSYWFCSSSFSNLSSSVPCYIFNPLTCN